jgi:hypothetical protein
MTSPGLLPKGAGIRWSERAGSGGAAAGQRGSGVPRGLAAPRAYRASELHQELLKKGQTVGDLKTERERKLRRTVFNLPRWEKHRSTTRYWR